jgi:hypothetical protein
MQSNSYILLLEYLFQYYISYILCLLRFLFLLGFPTITRYAFLDNLNIVHFFAYMIICQLLILYNLDWQDDGER